MGNTRKKLGETELEIMQVVWDSKNPITSNDILKELVNIFSKSCIIIRYRI